MEDKVFVNPDEFRNSPLGGFDLRAALRSADIGTGTTWNGNHTHTITVNSTGESGTNKNMPAYITCYIWRRTA